LWATGPKKAICEESINGQKRGLAPKKKRKTVEIPLQNQKKRASGFAPKVCIPRVVHERSEPSRREKITVKSKKRGWENAGQTQFPKRTGEVTFIGDRPGEKVLNKKKDGKQNGNAKPKGRVREGKTPVAANVRRV